MHDLFPIQSGPPFWSRSVHRTDLVKIRPLSRGLPGQNRVCPKSCPPGGGASPARPPLHTPRQLAGFGCLVTRPADWPIRVCPKPSPPTGQLRACPKLWVCPNPPPANWRDQGVSKILPRPPQGQSAGPNSTTRDASCELASAWGRQNPPQPDRRPPSPPRRLASPRRRDAGPGGPPVHRPLQAPGAAGALDGEVLTNKSSQGRADAQRLVATRLLDRVHDPLGHFSRLQRIYPRAR